MPVTINGSNTPTAGGVTYGDGTQYATTTAGTSGQVLQSNGASAPSWVTFSSTPTIVRSSRTSNTILGAADASTLIAITSGTFTQTFTAAATLGSGWFCYIQNSGTGDITLDPNGSETIDGLTSYIMYPGEARLVQCDGTGFNTIVLNAFYRTFTASGTFTKPPGYSLFSGVLWSAGSSGRKGGGGTNGIGGAGGGAFPFDLATSLFGASETVTIGAGGAGQTTTATNGLVGGASSLGSILVVEGSPSYTRGGAIRVPGQTGAFVAVGPNSGFAGSVDRASPLSDGFTIWGGAIPSNNATTNSASSVWGGGGGGSVSGAGVIYANGTSSFGGRGGSAGNSTSGEDGVAPAGGGGATNTGATSGAGARGELSIWGVI